MDKLRRIISVLGVALMFAYLAINQVRLQHQVNKLQDEIESHDDMLEQLGDAVTSLEHKGGK